MPDVQGVRDLSEIDHRPPDEKPKRYDGALVDCGVDEHVGGESNDEQTDGCPPIGLGRTTHRDEHQDSDGHWNRGEQDPADRFRRRQYRQA
jgi:hypothetical protein